MIPPENQNHSLETKSTLQSFVDLLDGGGGEGSCTTSAEASLNFIKVVHVNKVCLSFISM